jgi:hypothetical protein
VLSFLMLRPGRGQRAQSTIEFALIAPVFFLIFFGIVNGGLLLFSRNALQHAADVGAAEIATEGTFTSGSSNADQLALQQMQQSGLDNVVLTKVTGITVQEEDPVSGPSGNSLTPDTSGCGGKPCEMQYLYTGITSGPTGSPSGWTCNSPSVCTWPPDYPRATTQGPGLSGSPAFALITVYFTFSTIGSFASINLAASVVFRLEPLSL